MSAPAIDREQEQLFKDLLPVLDALDQACLHWEEARSLYSQPRSQDSSEATPIAQPSAPLGLWQRLWQVLQAPVWPPSAWSKHFRELDQASSLALSSLALSEQSLPEKSEESGHLINPEPAEGEEPSWEEVLQSGQEGVELIRQMVLDLLKYRKIIPLQAEGKPFDGKCMVALGRDVDTPYPANTVTQEVVRGYLWGDRILREAQVILAAPRT